MLRLYAYAQLAHGLSRFRQKGRNALPALLISASPCLLFRREFDADVANIIDTVGRLAFHSNLLPLPSILLFGSAGTPSTRTLMSFVSRCNDAIYALSYTPRDRGGWRFRAAKDLMKKIDAAARRHAFYPRTIAASLHAALALARFYRHRITQYRTMLRLY